MSLTSSTNSWRGSDYTFMSGYGGRVRYQIDPANPSDPGDTFGNPGAWIKDWSMEISINVFGSNTFVNPEDAFGVPWKRKDLLGLAKGKIDISGWIAASSAPIRVGVMYAIELRPGPTQTNLAQQRRIRVNGICSSVNTKHAVDATNPADIKASFEIASVPQYDVAGSF